MDRDPKNLTELLESSVARFAARPLFGIRDSQGWAWLTYAQFEREVAHFRSGLAALGIAPGDRVGIVAENCLEWAVACYATYTLGAVFVPMYAAQKPEEWEFVLGDCQARAVLAGSTQICHKLEQRRSRLRSLEFIIGIQGPEPSEHSFAALTTSGERAPRPPENPDATTPAAFIYTSGTTGQPKGVVLSHGNLASNVAATRQAFALSPEDRSLSFLPWAHAFGQTGELHTLISMGCAIAINDELARLIENLREVRPTVLVAVPRIFNRVHDNVRRQIRQRGPLAQRLFQSGLGAAQRRLVGERLGPISWATWALADAAMFAKVRAKLGGRLRIAVSGSAALSRDVSEFISALGIQLLEGYGLTETSPVVAANTPTAHRAGSVGRPLSNVEVRIEPCLEAIDGVGEILVRGPNVMLGYHNRPEETSAMVSPDGWLRTGDMGYLDDDGFLYLSGRIKEQYKLENGKYVVPSLLEEDLKRSLYIDQLMVHGANRPHNVALVVLDEQAVRRWGQDRGLNLGQLTEEPSVVELIERELECYGSSFKSYERPRAFLLVLDEFTVQNGMLTPTLKLKRSNVLDKYGPSLERLYDGASQQWGPSRDLAT